MLEIPLDATKDQKYRVALSVKSQLMADAYFDAMVRHTMVRSNMEREQAERVNRDTLRQLISGVHTKTRNRIQELYRLDQCDF